MDVSAAATMWQERAGQLGDRLAVAESKLLALAAPASSLEAHTGPHAADPTAEIPFMRWVRVWIAAPVAVLAIVAGLALVWPW